MASNFYEYEKNQSCLIIDPGISGAYCSVFTIFFKQEKLSFFESSYLLVDPAVYAKRYQMSTYNKTADKF